MQHPHFDRDAVAEVLGSSGHIAFEVHDKDPTIGDERWGPGALPLAEYRDQRTLSGMPTVLVTGAAGGVARLLLDGLRSTFDLRLTDREPQAGRMAGDLCDADFARLVCRGVDAVVHLAANPDPEQSFHRLRGPNAERCPTIWPARDRGGLFCT
jgi:hypothetical protein